MYQNILVTGGCGFIGTNFIKFVFNKTDFKGRIVNVDKLTYAANPENLRDIETDFPSRYVFEKGDICDLEKIKRIFTKYNIDCVVNFAAESHVDRSIVGPKEFIETNVVGTFALLEAARDKLAEGGFLRFHQISTDEVYGTLDSTGYFFETTPYAPRSPYSASKASADHLVRAYHNTYNLPITISICSNNYGPYQFPEKLIPFMILNMLEGKSLPVYGDGQHIRDWLYVEDHCSAVWKILAEGEIGETYNIGGENEWHNIDLVQFLCELVAIRTNKPKDEYLNLIKFVKDRPGHDRRYAINCDKIKRELGWSQSVDFRSGLERTVDWYLSNLDWINRIKSGEYLRWIDLNYSNR
jgi:dTDP-glucose 4,6-dehydratase